MLVGVSPTVSHTASPDAQVAYRVFAGSVPRPERVVGPADTRLRRFAHAPRQAYLAGRDPDMEREGESERVHQGNRRGTPGARLGGQEFMSKSLPVWWIRQTVHKNCNLDLGSSFSWPELWHLSCVFIEIEARALP